MMMRKNCVSSMYRKVLGTWKKKKESSDTSLNCVSNKPEFFDITWKGIIKGLNKKKIKSELTYHILLNYLHELCLRLGLKGKTKMK